MKIKFVTRADLLDSYIREELVRLNNAVIAKSPMDFYTIRSAVLPRWQFEADVATTDMVRDPDLFRIAWQRVLPRLGGGGGWSRSLKPPRPGGGPAGLPVTLKPKPTNDQGGTVRPMPVPAPAPKPDDQPAGGGMDL